MQQIFTILPHENFLRTATKHHRSKSKTTRSKSHENLLRIPSPESKKNLETNAKETCTAATTERAHRRGSKRATSFQSVTDDPKPHRSSV
jgi:hypothetical protein